MIRQFSAGGVVYKLESGKPVFLLRKNSSTPGYPGSGEWSLPKGWLDDAPDGINPGPLTLGQARATEDQIRQSALKEVREEGGVDAKIITRLDNIKIFFTDHNKQKVFKTVIFYLMEYLRTLPESFGSETTEICWETCEKSCEILSKRKSEAGLITKAEKIITSGQLTLL